MGWVYLLVAALSEVGWAIGLKSSHGFTKFGASLWTIAAMVISLSLLALAIRSIPVGSGYAVWTGISALGTAILGMILFEKPVTTARVLCLLLIVGGCAGLKLTGGS